MRSIVLAAVIAVGVLSSLMIVGYAVVVSLDAHNPAPNRPGMQVAHNNNIFLFNNAPVEVAPPAAEEAIPQENLAQVRGKTVSPRDCQLSGPYKHGNLAVFLIHGKDTLKDQPMMTLGEALEQGHANIPDPKFHHRLTIANSGKTPMFIQGGDIIKGGIQDRVLPYDLVVPPQSNNVSITALCVEQGRSFPRAGELGTSFQLSTEQLPGRKLKLAAHRGVQHEVWSNVQTLQANLTRNVGVRAPQTHSMQLTFENPQVQNAIQQYMDKLAQTPTGKTDVIGVAVTVNGRVQSADLYASAAMFQKVWPKLVKASAVDALAESQPGAVNAPPGADAVQAFLASAENAPAFRRQGPGNTLNIRQESAQTLQCDTCDSSRQNVVVHRSFLAK